MKYAPRRQRSSRKIKTHQSGLPDHLKVGIENLSGLSMDGVRVHYNSSEPAKLRAAAYSKGSEIHIAPEKERHLPHEAWHLVQQAQGRVRPTHLLNGEQINDDPALEREADVMGTQIASAPRGGSRAEIQHSQLAAFRPRYDAKASATVAQRMLQPDYRPGSDEVANLFREFLETEQFQYSGVEYEREGNNLYIWSLDSLDRAEHLASSHIHVFAKGDIELCYKYKDASNRIQHLGGTPDQRAQDKVKKVKVKSTTNKTTKEIGGKDLKITYTLKEMSEDAVQARSGQRADVKRLIEAAQTMKAAFVDWLQIEGNQEIAEYLR